MSDGISISIAGSATVGKDTFFTLLKTHLNNRVVTRFAFADMLKIELDPMFKAFGGTAFETDPIKKKLIRPILVAHGCSQRVLTNGRYWIDKIEPFVKESIARGEIAIITDCRFPNELEWIRTLKGKVIYLERIDLEGKVVPPYNDEERAHDDLLRAGADITVSWPTTDIHSLWPYVEKAAKELGLT